MLNECLTGATVSADYSAPDATQPQPRTSVFFAVAPVWDLSFQSIGIPALIAWCREAGYVTESCDLNIAFNRQFGGNELDADRIQAAYEAITSDPVFRDSYLLRSATEKVRLPLPFGFAEIVCNNYSRLPDFLEDERFNPFIAFARANSFIDRIAAAPADRPLLVGMGWDGENQVIATLTIAREIKRRRPDALVMIGGPWATAMSDVLRLEAVLLRDIDFILPKKAEAPLTELLQVLDREGGGRPKGLIPGVMINEGGAFSPYFPNSTPVKAENLPRPALFPLTDYRRENVLPYESERGCYWGKCKFCHHILTYTHGHNSKPIAKVIDDLKAYAEEFDYEVAAFVDAAMPPKRVREIAETFLAEDMNLRWAGFCRAERSFTPEIFEVARRSGLDVLSFGVEHASKKVLDFIGKPQNPAEMRRVLQDCAEAGIYTTAGVMNGLPSETYEDLDELLDFLDTIKDFVYLHPHMFKFERGSEFFRNAERYGLKVLENHPESRLAIYHDFEDANGGETRQFIKETNLNQNWWRENMRRTLDWKSKKTKGFCKAVEFIVDH
ncbi:radical SAM protein [Sphingomonas sp. DG1-23]|uniref:B12-binding domain-containing radical SAM protein n=1 Tax=Sphingomonas sp. DG1-23 TaxID=3068316 RepID=UPI00273E2C91|nr:radical SAM protein [Sphingomonas sp. DG1-23]MDP5279852.1 radical SAM protein [Sphingomonas sp. DG1-23]